MTDENLEPGLGEDNPDNSLTPETKETQTPQSLWGELSAEQKDFLGKKGFKMPADAIKSYIELEKQAGSKFSIPEDGDKEALAKIYKKLGKPEDISGYELETADSDKSQIDDFKSACLENNILPAQAKGIYEWYRQVQDKQVEAFNKLAQKEIEEVKQEWGADYDKNHEIMARGLKMLELTKEQHECLETALGSKGYMLLGKRIGDSISEGAYPGLKNSGADNNDDDDYAASCEREYQQALKKGATF